MSQTPKLFNFNPHYACPQCGQRYSSFNEAEDCHYSISEAYGCPHCGTLVHFTDGELCLFEEEIHITFNCPVCQNDYLTIEDAASCCLSDEEKEFALMACQRVPPGDLEDAGQRRLF